MEIKRYKPKMDKMFWIIVGISAACMVPLTIASALHPLMLSVAIPVDLLVLYFIVSPLFGYVELRDESIFIKFGLILKLDLPYTKIRGLNKARKFYSDSMLSLKNALEHVNIEYNVFDMITVSVKENDEFINDVGERIARLRA